MTIQRHPRHQARIDDERTRWARRAAIDAARTTITVNATTTGLTGVSAAHIHVGGPTVASGGVIFSLFSAADGAFTGAISKTLTSANLEAKPLEGVATFADAVNAILAGNAYINVHTLPNFSGGEIRGQLKQ